MSSGRDVVCAASQLFLREGTVRTFPLPSEKLHDWVSFLHLISHLKLCSSKRFRLHQGSLLWADCRQLKMDSG